MWNQLKNFKFGIKVYVYMVYEKCYYQKIELLKRGKIKDGRNL